jgi:hypothetical protein
MLGFRTVEKGCKRRSKVLLFLELLLETTGVEIKVDTHGDFGWKSLTSEGGEEFHTIVLMFHH